MYRKKRELYAERIKLICYIIFAMFPFWFGILSLVHYYRNTYKLFIEWECTIIVCLTLSLLVCLILYNTRTRFTNKEIKFVVCVAFISGCVLQVFVYHNVNMILIMSYIFSVLLIAFVGCRVCNCLDGKKQIILAELYVVIVAGLIRVILIKYLNNKPVSDFLRVYEYASADYIDHTSVVFENFKNNAISSPYYAIESITLRFILNIIGKSVFHAQIVNVVMACTVAFMLFKIGLLIFADQKISLLTALIYVFYPSAILQDTFLSHENYNIFFGTFFIYYFIKALKGEKKIKNTVLAAIFLGMADLYKPIKIIYWGAIVILFCFQIVTCFRDRKCIYIFIQMLIVIGVSAMISRTGIYMLEQYIGTNVYITPYKSMLIGLSTEPGNGAYSDELAVLHDTMWNESENVYKYNEKVIKHIYVDWKDNKNKIPKLFINKFISCWGMEDGYCYWATQGLNDSQKHDFSMFYNGIGTIICSYSLILYLLSIISLTSRTNIDEKFKVFVVTPIVLFALMLMLTEVQARYKSIVFVPICIMAGCGVKVMMYEKTLGRRSNKDE